MCENLQLKIVVWVADAKGRGRIYNMEELFFFEWGGRGNVSLSHKSQMSTRKRGLSLLEQLRHIRFLV